MQSARSAVFRFLQLFSTLLTLGLAAALISRHGPFAPLSKALVFSLLVGIAGVLVALLGMIPALTTTTMSPAWPMIADIIMSILCLIAAAIFLVNVGVKSCDTSKKVINVTNSAGLTMQYNKNDRYWTSSIADGQPGDGYLHAKAWQNRCVMNKVLTAALCLATIFFITSAIFSIIRFMKKKASADGSYIDGARYGPRQPKDDLVVVPEVREVA